MDRFQSNLCKKRDEEFIQGVGFLSDYRNIRSGRVSEMDVFEFNVSYYCLRLIPICRTAVKWRDLEEMNGVFMFYKNIIHWFLTKPTNWSNYLSQTQVLLQSRAEQDETCHTGL